MNTPNMIKISQQVGCGKDSCPCVQVVCEVKPTNPFGNPEYIPWASANVPSCRRHAEEIPLDDDPAHEAGAAGSDVVEHVRVVI